MDEHQRRRLLMPAEDFVRKRVAVPTFAQRVGECRHLLCVVKKVRRDVGKLDEQFRKEGGSSRWQSERRWA